MIRLWLPCFAQATRRGCVDMMMTKMTGRRKILMCFMATKRKVSKEGESERYRRFEIAKRHIPQNMLPREYEEEIKRLARKYKI